MPPGRCPPMLPRGVLGQLVRVLPCAPWRVPRVPPLEFWDLCFPTPLCAPLVPVRMCRAALAGSCPCLRALGPEGTLGRYCSAQRPCGACGPHVPGLLGLRYCVPVDNVPEGYACGRSYDVASLSVTGGAGGLVGVWLAVLPASPPMDTMSDLARKRGGSLAVGLLGLARLAAQCAGPSWRCSGRTCALAPTSQRRGAYRCVGLCLAVALIFGPFKAVLHPKDMLEGNCALVGGSLTLSGSWSRRGGVRGSRAHCVACGVPCSVLGVPGP